ncbi:DUF1189 domain-containing protein [Mesobacillus zeae]|uniref:DUF1189 domain-containing protein n=1 Tax=Mesobacillus zeae TaxID=1917180 RepID=A0A398B7Z0_9BACI|nr:DUF1189 domain-containing protein [Mesobacillus zeae]RID83833.1 DUF1189 domain-containing protein [Mesobacillus zeae]
MNIFKQYYKSLFSPKDIAMFRFQGIGKSILYVFLLTLIFSLPDMVYYSKEVATSVSAVKESFSEDVPSFVIEDGVLSSENKEPYSERKGDLGIVVDSSGALEPSDIRAMGETLAFLKNELVWTVGGKNETIPYTMFAGAPFSNKDVESFFTFANDSLAIFIPILVLTLYITYLGMKFIEVTFLAFFGLLLKNLAGRKLQYRHLWRMSAYSITMSTTFFTIMALLKTQVPSGFMINWFVSATILLLAIKEVPASKKAKKQ